MKAEVPALGLGGEKREWRGDLERFSEMPKQSLGLFVQASPSDGVQVTEPRHAPVICLCPG